MKQIEDVFEMIIEENGKYVDLVNSYSEESKQIEQLKKCEKLMNAIATLGLMDDYVRYIDSKAVI